MKKKIILMLAIVAILVCAFALSVSAEGYDTTRTVTLDDKTVCALYDSEGNALTYYLDGGVLKSIKTADIISLGNATIDKTTYVTFGFKNVSSADMVVVNFQDENLGDLQVFAAKFQGSDTIEYCYMPRTLERLSQNYDSANVFRETTKLKYVDFPIDCELNFIGKYSFSYATALEEIYIPANVTTFPESSGYDWGCFVSCTSLKKVTFAENSRLTTVPTYTFAHCTSLSEITLPDSVKTVEAYAFRNTAIVNSPFTVNSQCTYIGKWVFADCKSLREINIPKNATYNTKEPSEGVGLFQKCTALTTVNFHEDSINTLYPAHMFNGCTSLTYIKLPNTLTQLPVRMFNGCSKLETIVLGANVVGMNNLREFSDHNSFTYGCEALKTVYLPKTLNIDATNHSDACHAFTAGGNITFYFDGDYSEAVELQNSFKTNVTSCGNNGKITGAEIISLEAYNQLSEVNKCYIVYGVNTCDAFYDSVHKEDNNPCVINCDRCNSNGVAEANPVHNEATTIAYESYASNGTKTIGCTNEGCLHKVVTETSPLFENIGLSTSEFADGTLAIGYMVNHSAIDEYSTLTGKTVVYGVFAVLESNIEDNDIFDVDGKKVAGVVCAEITSDNASAFELKIVGFKTDEQKNASLAMGAYVSVTDGEGTKYSYLQDEQPTEGEKYYFTTYNKFVGIE